MLRAACPLLAVLLATSAVNAQAQYYELSPQDRVRLDALARQQAELRAAKAKLLRSAPLAAERNLLLEAYRK